VTPTIRIIKTARTDLEPGEYSHWRHDSHCSIPTSYSNHISASTNRHNTLNSISNIEQCLLPTQTFLKCSRGTAPHRSIFKLQFETPYSSPPLHVCVREREKTFVHNGGLEIREGLFPPFSCHVTGRSWVGYKSDSRARSEGSSLGWRQMNPRDTYHQLSLTTSQ
jgi:hypothetical protein